ncbi:uncharacterized protein LY79DRAFT_182119 [Colletotrichum navitas]|uniref:Uncharacterized protein n=1 Tax=Colletotrichum navitas TaxID=681940 RepID=A0AAD8Q021_9PEZI|nr:uncharacterized protein LY79DRAFT_182119 [Colletotrichum navitas]KAK1593272.1 hypothetical protein LY79DRAFT_182119 [Colletotrichum navitas]
MSHRSRRTQVKIQPQPAPSPGMPQNRTDDRKRENGTGTRNVRFAKEPAVQRAIAEFHSADEAA